MLRNLGEFIKEYQRPFRGIVFMVCIVFAFIGCQLGLTNCQDNPVTMTILGGMFLDIGVYTVSRTREKINTQELEKEKIHQAKAYDEKESS